MLRCQQEVLGFGWSQFLAGTLNCWPNTVPMDELRFTSDVCYGEGIRQERMSFEKKSHIDPLLSSIVAKGARLTRLAGAKTVTELLRNQLYNDKDL